MWATTAVVFGALITASASAADSVRDYSKSEPVVELDRIEVRSDRARDEFYKANRSSSATRTDTPLIDVPQSLTVITREQIEDQQVTSIADLVQYVPGVSAHQGENNRDQIIFRGNSSSADFFINGVRDDVQYYRDVYNLDRVEVLRGPNAMIFGRGGGGGVINRSTKEADFTPLREVSVRWGSFDQLRATLDYNLPLTKWAAVRLNALHEDFGSFRDGVRLQRTAVNPTLTLRDGAQTKVVVGYEYSRDRRTADRGITSWRGRPASVPMELFYGNPDDSHVAADVHLVNALIQHRTNSGLTIRNRTVFGDYDRFYQNYVPGVVNATQALVALTAYNNATQRQNVFNQTDLVYGLNIGGLQHTLLGGIEVGRQRTENFRQTGFFNDSTTSLNVPYASPTITTPVIFRQSATDAANHLKTDIGAVYVQDQIEFSRHWQAVLGLRFDAFSLQYHNDRNDDYLGRRDNLVSPRAGLIFKPTASVSLYGSYSVSQLPSSGDQFSSLTNITQQVKPEKFTNYEVGAKFDLRRDVFLTTAIYQLDRTNTRATDPNDPTRIVQTGSQRTRGLEVGLNGSITDSWTASIGYAFQDAFINRATTAARAGAIVAQVPRHSFSLWNKFQISPKLGVGLGVVQRSAVFATIDDSVVLPGYTRVDAAVFYAFNDTWRAQLNVENALDKKYYANADSNTNISPGSPRALRIGVSTRF